MSSLIDTAVPPGVLVLLLIRRMLCPREFHVVLRLCFAPLGGGGHLHIKVVYTESRYWSILSFLSKQTSKTASSKVPQTHGHGPKLAQLSALKASAFGRWAFSLTLIWQVLISLCYLLNTLTRHNAAPGPANFTSEQVVIIFQYYKVLLL